MRKIVLMTLTAAALLLLPGCGRGELQVFNDITGEPYANSNQYAAGNFTYNAADIDAIELCWRTGSVELLESGESTLSVTESGKDLDADAQMRHWLDGRTLRIQFCQSGASVHVKNTDKMLTLELPKYIRLTIYNTAADIHAETLTQESVFVSSHSGEFACGSLTAASADVSSSSGRITADRVEADALKLSTASGKVEVGDTVLSDALSCTSVSGNLAFRTLYADRLAIDTTSANVDIGELDCPSANINSTSGILKLALPENGAKLRFVTVSGSLKTSLTYENAGNLRIFGNGESEINVATISGGLELR